MAQSIYMSYAPRKDNVYVHSTKTKTTTYQHYLPKTTLSSPFEMELAIAPPTRIPAGIQLGAPLVVTFQASKLKRRPATAESEDGQDLSGVWAYVSLTNEDRSRILAPPATDLLQGNPAASISPLSPKPNAPFAYAVFSGLTITTPGRYCFRVNVIDMNRCVGKVRLAYPGANEG
jgi:hypothetical protein